MIPVFRWTHDIPGDALKHRGEEMAYGLRDSTETSDWKGITTWSIWRKFVPEIPQHLRLGKYSEFRVQIDSSSPRWKVRFCFTFGAITSAVDDFVSRYRWKTLSTGFDRHVNRHLLANRFWAFFSAGRTLEDGEICELCEICVFMHILWKSFKSRRQFFAWLCGTNKSPSPISCIIHHTLTQGKKHPLGGTFGMHEHVNTCEARDGHVLWILIQHRGASCVSTVVLLTSEVAAAGGKLYGCLVLTSIRPFRWGREINDVFLAASRGTGMCSLMKFGKLSWIHTFWTPALCIFGGSRSTDSFEPRQKTAVVGRFLYNIIRACIYYYSTLE